MSARRRYNYARINHLLIPSTKEGRDRWRRSTAGRLMAPAWALYDALTPLGMLLSTTALLSVAFSLDVEDTDAHLLWAAQSGLLVACLLLARLLRLPGVTLAVSAPRRVVQGEALHFTLTVKNGGAAALQELCVGGPFLPWDGRFVGPQPALARLAPGAAAQLRCEARFSARGEHHLDPFRLARLGPLGLALGPAVRSEGCRFLVVPRPAQVLRLTTPESRRHQPGGVALASRVGESMDLHGVRPYRPGDPVRDLHARSWARSGSPVVREYQQEYFTRIGVVVDTDAAGDERLLDAALALAAGALQHLARGEALIDLLVLGQEAHTLTLGRALGRYEQALDLLACVAPPAQLGALPRLRAEALMQQLEPHLPRLSCVVLVLLRWDEARAEVLERLRRSGALPRGLLLGAGAAPAADLQVVPVDAVLRGDALWL